jgi:integrase
MTFDELIQLYQKEGDGRDYILKPAQTYLRYFGGKKLAHITRRDLFNFRDQVKSTPKQRGGEEVTDSHVNRLLAGLRRLFNFAVDRELMEGNPFPKTSKSGLFYSEQKGLRNFFTEEQMRKIVDASPEWLNPIVITAYLTGMRESELLSLRWEWVDLHTGVIYLPSSKTLKDPTGKGQRIVMQRELVDLFQSLPKRSEWVFCKPDGMPYRHWNTFKAFRRVLRSLGIDTKQYSWKEIRHSTASIMNLKGSPPMAIKDQLRHTSVNTTESFYIGSNIEYQRMQNEKLSINSGKIVGNALPQEPYPVASA